MVSSGRLNYLLNVFDIFIYQISGQKNPKNSDFSRHTGPAGCGGCGVSGGRISAYF
jgi:hypothetical protein